MRVPLVLALFPALLAVGVPRADACSCEVVGPACQAFWKTAAVFDGTVVTIEPRHREGIVASRTFSIPDYVVTLNVRQSWKGVDAGQVEVLTSGGPGSCGFGFKTGRRYLVFAERRTLDGQLSVSICNLTREFDSTGEAADFLASLAEPAKGGRAFGSIDLVQRSFKSDHASIHRTPMNLVVRLTGNDRTLTTTASGGRYEFSGLAPGNYEVAVTLPEGYSTWRSTQSFEIPDARGCARTNFSVSPVIDLSLGQQVDLGRWELTAPLPVVQLTGWIVWKDGSPAAGVYVSVADVTGNPIGNARGAGGDTARADGRFAIEVREGRDYTIMARAGGTGTALSVSAPRIHARRGLEPVRIVIERDPPR